MKALIIHGLRFDSRLTTFQHTLAFARHLNGFEVTYVNGQGLIDESLLTNSFDVAIVTYELLALRNTPFWVYVEKRLAALLQTAKIRVVMPQDDYSSSSKLDNFIVSNKIHHVFSPLTRDLIMIYPRSIAAGVKFSEAFTGYWETKTDLPFQQYRVDFHRRPIDVGQRVRHLPPQLGPVAQKKGEIAIKFADSAKREGFMCDVSTRENDVLVGADWWKFLGRIKFTVGRLGGASVVDPQGHLARKVNQLQLRNPKITFEKIAKKLHTDQLDQGDFSAISPRLFECAAMGVCQILEKDNYFENFEPWIDYLPLDSDLNNLSEIFAAMRDVEQCHEIADHAEETLINSGKYSYFEFVKRLVKTTLDVDLESDLPPVLFDHDEELFYGQNFTEIESVKKLVRQSITWKKNGTVMEPSTIGTRWLEAFRESHLIVESLTLPWCSALVHMKVS
jgi:hypothetical protein